MQDKSPTDMSEEAPVVAAVASDLVRFWADDDSIERREVSQSVSPVASEIAETTTELPEWLVAALLSANDSEGVFENPTELEN